MTNQLRDQVRRRAGYRCEYCLLAKGIHPGWFSIDHIIPEKHGGPTELWNLAWACLRGNRYKSDRISAPDPVTLKEVALFHPQQHRWHEHFSWNEGAAQIVGLTPTGRATIAALKMNRPQMMRVRRMWVAMNEHPPDLD